MIQTNSARAWLTWLVVGLLCFYCYAVRVAPSTDLPAIMMQYHVGPNFIGWLNSSFYLAYALIVMFAGLMCDFFKLRYLILISMSMVLGGYVWFIHGHVFWEGVASRFLIGLGSAFPFVITFRSISLWFSHNRMNTMTGLTVFMNTAGAVAGMLVLTWATQRYGVTVSHTGFVKIGVILLLIAVFVMPLDQRSNNVKPTNKSFARLAVDLAKTMRRKQAIIVSLFAFFIVAPTTGFAELWAAHFLRNVCGCTEMLAAHMTSYIFIGWLVGSPLFGVLADRLQHRKRWLLIGSITGMLLSFVLVYVSGTSSVVTSINMFFIGVCSSVITLGYTIFVDLTPKDYQSSAVALVDVVVMFSGFIMQPVIGMVLTGFMHIDTSVWAYRNAMLVAPACFMLAAVLAFFIKDIRSKHLKA